MAQSPGHSPMERPEAWWCSPHPAMRLPGRSGLPQRPTRATKASRLTCQWLPALSKTAAPALPLRPGQRRRCSQWTQQNARPALPPAAWQWSLRKISNSRHQASQCWPGAVSRFARSRRSQFSVRAEPSPMHRSLRKESSAPHSAKSAVAVFLISRRTTRLPNHPARTPVRHSAAMPLCLRERRFGWRLMRGDRRSCSQESSRTMRRALTSPAGADSWLWRQSWFAWQLARTRFCTRGSTVPVLRRSFRLHCLSGFKGLIRSSTPAERIGPRTRQSLPCGTRQALPSLHAWKVRSGPGPRKDGSLLIDVRVEGTRRGKLLQPRWWRAPKRSSTAFCCVFTCCSSQSSRWRVSRSLSICRLRWAS